MNAAREAPPNLRSLITRIENLVALEHAEADPVNVYLPYKHRRPRTIEYGELFTSMGERRVVVDAT